MDNSSNIVKAISYFSNIIHISYTVHTFQLIIGKDLIPILVFIIRIPKNRIESSRVKSIVT